MGISSHRFCGGAIGRIQRCFGNTDEGHSMVTLDGPEANAPVLTDATGLGEKRWHWIDSTMALKYDIRFPRTQSVTLATRRFDVHFHGPQADQGDLLENGQILAMSSDFNFNRERR